MQLWQPIAEKTRKVAANVSAWIVEIVPKTTVVEPTYIDRVSAWSDANFLSIRRDLVKRRHEGNIHGYLISTSKIHRWSSQD